MKKETYIPKNAIISIEVYDKQQSRYHTFYPRYEIITPKRWGIFGSHKPNVVYTDIFVDRAYHIETYLTADDILSIRETYGDDHLMYIIENNIVYYRPYITIRTKPHGNDILYIKRWFDTFEEACQYARDIVVNNNLSENLIKI